MHAIGKLAALLCLAAVGTLACACRVPGLESGDSLSILSYNTQTLFDDEYQGSEFSEYIPSDDGWNTVAYHQRLRNLARVIRESCAGGPDVVVLQEVENAGVVEDLVGYFLSDAGYRYAAGAFADGAAFGQAVLSRYELSGQRSVSAGEKDGILLRPSLEIRVDVGEGKYVQLFAVHWKSKLGDAEQTERYRRLQAHSIARRIADSDTADRAGVLIAGDFNESPMEFTEAADREYVTALAPREFLADWRLADDGLELEPLVLSDYALGTDADGLYRLWALAGEGAGSYCYQGEWEQIDNMFVDRALARGEVLKLLDFHVVTNSYLLDSDGEPRAYQRGRGYGYSDHLPILLELRR